MKNPKAYLYRLLARQAYLRRQLLEKLRKQKIPLETCHELLDECEKLGYIDDTDYAGQFIKSQKRKHKSRYWTLNKLIEKGCDRALAQQTLEEIYPPEEEQEIASYWTEKYSDEPAEKIARKLRSRGFLHTQ